MNGSTFSVVVPALKEEAALPEFHRRLTAVLTNLPAGGEIAKVTADRTDRTREFITGFGDQRVTVIDLSRNFGKKIAMTAGVRACPRQGGRGHRCRPAGPPFISSCADFSHLG